MSANCTVSYLLNYKGAIKPKTKATAQEVSKSSYSIKEPADGTVKPKEGAGK